MLNLVKLYSGHLRSSRKTLLIASIGLIAALTIVSSTNYYFDNSKKAIVDDYFDNIQDYADPYYSSDIVISLSSFPPYDSKQSDKIMELITQTQSEYGINFFKSINQSVTINGLTVPVAETDQFFSNRTINVVQITPDLESDLNALNHKNSVMINSTIPESQSQIPEVYVLIFNEYLNYNYRTYLENESNIIQMYDCLNCQKGDGNVYPVNVTGMGILNPYEYIFMPNTSTPNKNPDYNKYPTLQALRTKSNFYFYSNIFLFTRNITSFASMIKPIAGTNDFNSGYYVESAQFYYYFNIQFDYSKIDPYNSGLLITKVNQFRSSLYDKMYNQLTLGRQTGISIDFRSKYLFESINNQLISFIFILALVSLPILICTIFIINYSFGLIHKNVVRHIGIYKTRGMTSTMLFLFQLIDNIIIIVFSILVALLTGIPLSMLVLQTDFLLSFNYPAPSYYILNFQAVADLLLYIAIILILTVNFRRVFRLSKLAIIDTEQPVEKEEPAWKRHYFDVILFSFGMLMYGTFYVLVQNPTINQSLGPILGILAILIIPAPFALVLGLVLLVNRLIPIILNKVGTFLWIKTGDLTAFSFKNVIRHKQASTRAIMLVSILIAFMVFFYALPYSLVLNNEQSLYYSNGAEVVASFGSSGYNVTSLQIIQNNFSQYLEGFSPYLLISTPYSSEYGYSSVLLVNTTSYLDAAYLKFDLGLEKDLTSDFRNIQFENTTGQPFLKILVDKHTLDNRKTSIGQNITIIGPNNNLKVQIVDTFKNWPILRPYYGDQNYLFGIGDIGYYLHSLNQSLTNSPFTDINAQGVLFNFKDGVNQTLISSWIEGNTSLTISSLTAESQKQYYSGINFRLTVGQINNDVLMVIAISIIVLIMFAYLQLQERKKEIFTERALGMKLHQIASLFFIETIILSLTSVILGLGVGLFLMELLALLIFNPSQSYPAFEILFPTELLLITTGLIMLSSIIVSIIPAYYTTKQEIFHSFGEA